MPKIAIIEDDQATNDHLKGLVKSLGGTEVFQAFDRASADQLIASCQFDLVIVDIELGQGPKDKYGGLGILSSLRDKRTVTLVVSGMPEQNLPDVAISLRAYDFIGKPIDDLDFLNKLEHALSWQERDDIEQPHVGGERTWPKNLEPDPTRHLALRWKGKPVRLSITQQRLVHCLIEEPGRPVEYAKLKKQLDSSNSNTAIATHLSDVRKRFLDVDPAFDAIDSEPGKGYVWKTFT